MNSMLLDIGHAVTSRFLAAVVLLPWLLFDAVAAPSGAGYRETVIAPVPTGETSNLVDRLTISEGSYNKTDAGTLALAASNLLLQADGRLVVRDGTLRVQGDDSMPVAPVPCPSQVLSNAAFWVDATTNLITVSSNGTTYVDAWLDVREPDTVAPFVYTRAVANWKYTNASPELVNNAGVGGTLPSVWFRGYGSSRFMMWTTPADGTNDITNIYHVFAVHGVFQSYGFVFGAMIGTPDFHIGNLTGTSINNAIWSPYEPANTVVRQGRTYLDGARVDGTLTYAKAGWQLLEASMDGKLAHASNFFNDRIYTSGGKQRAGGDNLCEVVVFTNRLSETERMQVQSYLMQKWLGTQPPRAPLTAHASASGTVAADVAENGTLSCRLNGDGTFLKQGAGVAVLEATQATTNLFRSAIVQSGKLDARIPVPLSLSAGDRVTTSNTLITVTQTAGTGQLAKDGPGTVTLSSVPADVTQLNVNGGTLALAAPVVSASVSTAVTGSVPNATFEEVLFSTGVKNFTSGETYHGWTAHSSQLFIYNRTTAADNYKWPCPYDAPEGQQVLAFKQDASASTSLSLPVAGVYDVSFYTSARSIGVYRHELDLCLVDGATTNAVATIQTINQPYTRQTFRLPWLEDGTHTLLFRRNVTNIDTLATIDDIKVTLVSEIQPDSVKIPNGDFELTDYPRVPTAFSTSNVARAWTFTAPTNNEVSAGITMASSPMSSMYTPSTPYGAVMLCLVSNGVARTTFTLPAGTYNLQAALCNWPCYIGTKGFSSYGQTIKATITRASGSSDDLGNLSTGNGCVLTTKQWPTAFSVTNNETVTLTLTGTTTSGVGLIDNLELIPQTSSIIQNGGFESNANWTFVSFTSIDPKASAGRRDTSTHAADYGTAVYDGVYRLLLIQIGAAVQDIQLPAPGLYRLVFHASQRYPASGSLAFGHNPVRAWLAQDGVTNAIGWTRVEDNEMVRREFLFNVAAAGTYRFGLQGMTDNSEQFPGTDQNALLDGVSIEPVSDLAPDGVSLPERLAINIADGALVQLSFAGTQNVDRVKLGGRFVSGVISQETYPEAIIGPGAVYAEPKGTLLMFL